MVEDNNRNSNNKQDDNSDNNNDADIADNANQTSVDDTLPAEKARKQYLAERELAQFARLFYARAPEEVICRELNIHRSTYYRWLEKLGDQHKELMNEHAEALRNAEEASFRNTLKFVEQTLKQIMLNKDSEDVAKIEAAQLLCDISHAQVRLLEQGHVKTVKQLPAKIKKKLIEMKPTEETTEGSEYKVNAEEAGNQN